MLDRSLRDRGLGKGVKQGRIWVNVRDPRPWAGTAPPGAVYRFAPDWKQEHVHSHLARTRGILQADGYKGYAKLYDPDPDGTPRLQEASCWAHLRRDFHDEWDKTKSTIAREAVRQWKQQAANTVLIDGDEVRQVFASEREPDAYAETGRRRNGERIVEICAWLDRQGINAVCSILSMFEDHRRRNRQDYSRYFEVFVDVPMEKLVERDTKGLYGRALKGEIGNVVGVDIPFEPPANPDLVIDNSGDGLNAAAVAADILARAGAVP